MRNENGAPRSLQAERGAMRWNDRAMQYITEPVCEDGTPRWKMALWYASFMACALAVMAGDTITGVV